MRAPWSSPRRWTGTAAGLAVVAVLAAAAARPVVFDLVAEDEARTARHFAAGAREVELDPRPPGARLPHVLPGPADVAAGATAHSVRFRLGRRPPRDLVLFLYTDERATPTPSRLTIAVNDVPLASVGTSPGPAAATGPAHHPARHKVPVPAASLVPAADVRLSIVNEAGPTVVLRRARLVEAAPALVWSRLSHPGRLPTGSALALAASLAALATGGLGRARAAAPARGIVGAATAAATLAVLGLTYVLAPDTRLVAGPPRWLWLALPGVLLGLDRVLAAVSARRARPGGAAPARLWWRLLAVNAAVALVALGVSLAGAELVLRAWFRAITSAGDTRSYFHREADVRNSVGFREREFSVRKPDGVYRIAVIGDSLTWAPGVATEDRFSRLVERALGEGGRPGVRYEVLNFGRSGLDTEEEVQVLRQLVLPADPDFVLLQWYVNDFENGDQSERPRPAPLVRPVGLHRKLLGASALYALLDPKWTALQEALGLVEPYTAYMARRFGDPDSPDSRFAIEQIKAFVGECRARRVPMGIVLFPHVGPDLAEGAYDYDYLHDRVLEACRDDGVSCLDLRAVFAGYPDYRTLWITPFDAHPNRLANRLAAEQLLETFGPIWRAGSPGR
jgi:hypothetical protein